MRASPTIFLLAIACRSPLPEPNDVEHRPPSLVIEPAAELDAVLPVSRFTIADAEATGALLVSGELSEYYLRKIEAGEPPNTLLERSVECMSFVDERGLVLAPTAALVPGETYSLATERDGLLATFQVTSESSPFLGRTFPPVGALASASVIYCGAPGSTATESPLLEPGHVPLHSMQGIFEDARFPECVTLRADGPLPDGTYVPPVTLGGASVDPAPWLVAPTPAALPVTCEADEQPFGNGCIQVLDDRALVRSPATPVLWAISGDVPAFWATPESGARFLVGGLAPSTSYTLGFGVLDASGAFDVGEASIFTAPPSSHVVINEVLANPLGAEPAQEWIELVNDGLVTVELEGFVLSDAAGPSVLPAHSLVPGAFVLLAREDFSRDDGSDVPIPSDVVVLALSTLGKNGLTNSGERLELRTPEGETLSAFPPLPKPKAGVSVARREPWALDDDAASFALHADPGASPGAPNSL